MNLYPDLIRNLPLADLPFEGVEGHMLRSVDGLLVFFHFHRDVEVPLHSHGAQWGIVVKGEFEFTIGDTTKLMRPGDSYAIARGQQHGGLVKAGVRLIDFFEEPGRYRPKKP